MTLPTRADGGIDREKLRVLLAALVEGATDRDGEAADLGEIEEFVLAFAAHTRERCAKWHDEQAVSIAKATVGETDGQRATMLISLAQEHMMSAAAIRKMED